ncbi:ATP-binding protein [Actinoplanes sp. NPDC023801]|uniref:ATP-binding protein n=1 Tax=Actinoplanes sp. NPDC023801 TaxID=3154595 RepID=UPI0033FAD15A
MSVQRRLNAGFAALLALFSVLLMVQFGAGSRLRADQEDRLDRVSRADAANDEALQRMTDAETGVRGFQLTGQQSFLDPYEKGWAAALAALDDIATGVDGTGTRRLLDQQREAARIWLDAFALPIIDSGMAAGNQTHAVRGKQLFDEFRLLNEAVAASIEEERREVVADGAAARRRLDVIAAVLVGVILTVAVGVALTVRRQLLVPLGRISATMRRLTAGDRSARAEPVRAAELRTVVKALNDLAAQTETLLAAEQSRAARAGLRQAVAAEMQEMRDQATGGRRIAELIGAAVGADAVHCDMGLPGTGRLHVHWPSGSPEPPAGLVSEILAGTPGQVRVQPDGSVWLAVGDGAVGAPGYLHLSRPGAPVWTEAEQRLLAGVVREIERVQRQLGLQDTQARLITELRLLDQRKDVFIQTVTHELRTPLTSILGYAEMIADEDGPELNAVQERALSAILRNAHRLRDTIGDLVLLDRPQYGAAVQAEILDLAPVARLVLHELHNAAQAKGLTVNVDTPEAWVRGDRTQLRRALRKVIENAIKFTPAGGSVDCRMTADPHTVSIAVTDTGIGIPDEDVPGLFTPFHRAGNAMDQAVQGPGLGLAIVRDIVRDHGGTVAVQSVVGRGSTFTLTLPAIPAPAPTEPKSPARV